MKAPQSRVLLLNVSVAQEDADLPASDEIGRIWKRLGFGLNENTLGLLQVVTHSINEKLSVNFI